MREEDKKRGRIYLNAVSYLLLDGDESSITASRLTLLVTTVDGLNWLCFTDKQVFFPFLFFFHVRKYDILEWMSFNDKKEGWKKGWRGERDRSIFIVRLNAKRED